MEETTPKKISHEYLYYKYQPQAAATLPVTGTCSTRCRGRESGGKSEYCNPPTMYAVCSGTWNCTIGYTLEHAQRAGVFKYRYQYSRVLV